MTPDNPEDPEFQGDLISLLATTTVPGAAGIGDPSTPEDDRRMFYLAESGFPIPPPHYSNMNTPGIRGPLIAPSGEVILMDGDTLGLGLNIFGVDCLVLGKYRTFKGRF